MTRGTGLARASVWNFLGQAAPLPVALLLTPATVRGFGDERFGLLGLAWATIGYLSFLDFGLSRAVTRSVAAALEVGDRERARRESWTALWILTTAGVAGGVLLFVAAPFLVTRTLKMSEALVPESIAAVRVLALALPFTLLMNGLRGVLEALRRFDLVNAVRIPFGVFTFVGPWASLQFTTSLTVAVATLMVARVLAVGVYGWMARRDMGESSALVGPDRTSMRELLSFGVWITVSNVISPLMVYFDRFVIGGIIAVAMVTYYVTPFQVVTQLLMVSTSIAGALFPSLAAAWATDRERVATLGRTSTRMIVALVFPAVALVIAIAPEALHLWLGPRFEELSAAPARWLAAGVFFNSVAQVPFVTLHAAGRADLTAKAHLVELPVYLALLFALTPRYGIAVVGMLWCMRALLDLVLLFWLAAALRGLSLASGLRFMAGLAVAGAALALPSLVMPLSARLAIWGAMTAVCVYYLADDLRASYGRLIKRVV